MLLEFRTKMTPPIDMSRLQAIAGDDDALAQDLLELYRDDTASRFSAMREALAKGDKQALRMQAHALKGASANIGAGRMQALSKTLEEKALAGELEGSDLLIDQLAAEYKQVVEFISALY
jgi:HPt (histidine-containing phosphotransfer) domain-containing protein